jgi:hypothetical protein
MGIICYDGKDLSIDSGLFTKVDTNYFLNIEASREGEYWEIDKVKVIVFAVMEKKEVSPYIIEKLKAGISHTDKFTDEPCWFDALLIDEYNRTYRWTSHVGNETKTFSQLVPELVPIAFGHGDAYARGVLSIGNTSRAAVKAAIRLDKRNWEEIQSWFYRGIPDESSVRPK